MIEKFMKNFNPVIMALFATLFTWGVTAPRGGNGFLPEGLAVAFGAIAAGLPSASLAGALAIGIGLQNFPEGAAVSIPLRREGLSRLKSFMFGQASAIVEPVAAVLGALLVISVRPILPYALSFAAGAMIFVVIEELIPESQRGNSNTDISTIGAMLGFSVMMFLDVALG
jgi:ZIP family zinc transporter